MERKISRILRGFIDDEQGFATHFALTVMMLVILFAGLSVDSTNAWRTKFILQSAADAAARAGAMALPNENDARAAALELAADNLDNTTSGNAITANSITFGSWNTQTRVFSAKDTPINAVQVIASRTSKGANPVPTFFLRLAGLKSWDIQVESVAYRATNTCASVDISTDGKFEIASDNEFYNGFCVAAAKAVELGDNNGFDNDNSIRVSSLSDIGFADSESLSTAVGRGTSNSKIGLTYRDIFKVKSGITAPYVSDIAALANNFLDPYYSGQPAYINPSAAVINLSASEVKYTSFAPGRIYNISCGGADGEDEHAAKAQFYKKTQIKKVVIVSDCAINIGKQSVLEDVVLVSRATGSKSVYVAKRVRLGKDDDCAAAGGVSIYTAGGFKSKDKLEVYGSTISAKGKVEISNKSGGIAGIAINAGGDVSFSESASFGTCKNTASDSADVAYYLVK